MLTTVIFLLKKLQGKYLELYKKYWQKPVGLGLVIIILYVLQVLIVAVKKSNFYEHALTVLIIITLTWFLIQALRMIKDLMVVRISQNCSNKLDAQRINTQMDILVRITTVALGAIGVSLVLMTFPQIRQIGISILASAGIASVILGFAAQKSLGSVLAGIQIAFTQPIKIGDEVWVENENGVIEEINLTYVIMRTTDKRRVIIPINYFIENIFQNWTMNSSDLLGVVYIEVDYAAPVQKIRDALAVILEGTTWWDKKTKILQVTNSKAQTMELRILVSAINPTCAWNLKCYVREKLIEFLQNNYPDCLPKMRLELSKR